MKVLMINTVDTARNGITSVIFNYVKAMKGHGIIFDLATKNTPESSYVEEIESTGGNVYIVPRSIKKIARYFSEIKRLIQKNGYDVVHVHGNSGTCTIEAAAAKQAKSAKVIVHAHSSSCKYQIAHKALKPTLNRLVDGRVACSELAGEFLFGKHEYLVLNNAIDAEKYRYRDDWRNQIRWKHNIEQDAILVGHVGTFSYAKNHEFLIQVFHSFQRIHKKAVLLLIGEGELESEIRARVHDLGLDDHVVFVGSVDNVNEYMSAFDCFILPSRFEGLGLVLLEAQASGLSCLVSASVPNIVNITGNVVFVALDQPIQNWAVSLASCINGNGRSEKSEDAIQKLFESGYHLSQLGDVLKEYYETVCE